jgi:cytochrome b561
VGVFFTCFGWCLLAWLLLLLWRLCWPLFRPWRRIGSGKAPWVSFLPGDTKVMHVLLFIGGYFFRLLILQYKIGAE